MANAEVLSEHHTQCVQDVLNVVGTQSWRDEIK